MTNKLNATATSVLETFFIPKEYVREKKAYKYINVSVISNDIGKRDIPVSSIIACSHPYVIQISRIDIVISENLFFNKFRI